MSTSYEEWRRTSPCEIRKELACIRSSAESEVWDAADQLHALRGDVLRLLGYIDGLRSIEGAASMAYGYHTGHGCPDAFEPAMERLGEMLREGARL